MTIREQIIQAALEALNTARPPGVPNAVERTRTFAISASMLPMMIVYPKHESVKDVGGRRGPMVARALTLFVDCYGADETWIDALTAWAVAKLSDNTFGGLVNETTEDRSAFAYDQAADGPIKKATVAFTIDYDSPAGNLEAVGPVAPTPTLIPEDRGNGLWRFTSSHPLNLISASTVTAPSAGFGTVQLFNHDDLPNERQVVIGTITASYFEAQHGEQGAADYEWVINGVQTPEAVLYTPLSARFTIP